MPSLSLAICSDDALNYRANTSRSRSTSAFVSTMPQGLAIRTQPRQKFYSIAFTISVLYLCAAEVYFQDITKPDINTTVNTFQFVAALHNVMIGISDGAIAVYYLKYELYRGMGLSYARHISRPKITLSSPNFSRPIMRPLAQTQCSSPVDITGVFEMFNATFPADQLQPSSEQTFASSLSQVVNITSYKTSSPVVQFIDLTKTAGQPLTGALVGMNFSAVRNLSFHRDEAVRLMGCTLTAHWVPTTMSIDPNVGNVVIPDYPNPLDMVNSRELMERAHPIDIQHSYTYRVDAQLEGLRVNVLEYELGRSGIKPDLHFDGSWKHRWSWVAATLLSMQMTDALARINTDTTMYTYCYLCRDQSESYSKGKSAVTSLANQNVPTRNIKTGASEADWASDIVNHPDLYMPVSWTVQRYGYGWSLKGTTAILAAVVLLVQVSLVIVYL
ncbi:uncharacterized protein A1O5_06141 [Cladophialophora psammophila CBS 110553]|uniref:Transmembrane protein n=1 Tax=Cladophialophora psammophila CBS 110553 TaxID=1182543 RepID=W9WSF9_9EURO|nr:uncharacterized protein A1O5_06141 [Cladophialophora psammophila CBS 110553]EXJ71147.1 hypothetical protein A1O5_06141 [Cladophialophora psammophila CBS 110553]